MHYDNYYSKYYYPPGQAHPSPFETTTTSNQHENAHNDNHPGDRVHGGGMLGTNQDGNQELDLTIPPVVDSVEQAWRWRFTRRWHMEQTRQQEEPTKDNEEDDWVAALDYLATARGANLQFARAPSVDRTTSFDGALSQSMSMLLVEDASLPRDASLQNESLRAVTPMATRSISQAVKRAEQLMAHQQEIEKKVTERWESAESQEPWAAHRIAAVKIDSWGTFPFILARVMDTVNGRQKLLIRGCNRSTVEHLSRQLRQEISQEARQQRLPVPRIDVLGSGSMEWSREREQCLNILGTALHDVIDTRLSSKDDVANVAAALTKTGLTAIHKVVVVQQPRNIMKIKK